jgi:predicted nucleic acid-binding protein
MRFLLDTCIVSDVARKGQFPQLEAWLNAQHPTDLAIGTITLGELRYGIERLPHGRKRTELLTWLETELPAQFANRILAFDDAAADAWGILRATGERIGRPLPLIDGQLLATAHAHRLIFVTRNERDVEARGVGVLNPY